MKKLIGTYFFATVLMLAVSHPHACGQSLTYGGIGDPALAPGSPSSSYALSGLDHVNYYNGLTNLTVPLNTIGGRGTVSQTMLETIQEQWNVVIIETIINGTGHANNTPVASNPFGNVTNGGAIDIGFQGSNPTGCVTTGSNGQKTYSPSGTTLSYIIWTKVDGTQVILRDLKSNGQPQPVTSCGSTLYDRGTTFQSSDGSDTIFIASADVIDDQPRVFGTIITRDGTRYQFSGAYNDGYQTGIEDRNGNLILFAEKSGTVVATDPLQRSQTTSYTGANNGPVVSYPGFNGSQHAITENYVLLQNALVSGESIQTYACLFPELQGSASSSYNPYVVSSIVLADGTSYSLQYNAYGEAVKLTLPTGAAYVYKYSEASKCTSNTGSGVVNLNNGTYAIHRTIQERDEYANGTALSGITLFSWASTSTGGDPNFSSRPTTICTVTFEDQNSQVLRIEKHYFWGNPAPTNSPAPNPTEFARWWLGIEYQTDIIDATRGTLQSTARAYGQRPCPGAGELSCPNGSNLTVDTAAAHDPQLCQSNVTLSVKSLVGSIAYLYDQYNNPTDEYDFDFGSTQALNGACPTSFTSPLRHTKTTYLASNSVGSYTAASTNILSLPSDVQILDGSGNVLSHSTYGYDEGTISNAGNIAGHDNTNYARNVVRGNLTTISQYLNTTNTSLSSHLAYDIAGNLRTVSDPLSHVTAFDYTDSYPDGNRNTYAHPGVITNALNEKQYSTWDYGSGKPLSSTNTSGLVTKYSYSDPFDRLTQLIHPDTSQMNVAYTPTEVTSYQDQTTAGDKLLATLNIFDGLGRSTQRQQTDSGSTYITTTTAYDALGRVSTTTNPSRAGDGLNFPTIYSYDSLGRTLSITTNPDGNSSTNAYSGNVVTQTDQAGRAHTYTYDALSRLTNVIEDPSSLKYQTSYTYDVLGNLLSVTQGAIKRGFAYDTLSRLTSATNPESGTVGYSYYDSGTLHTRTDAKPVVATYVYDALNRLTGTSYNDNSTQPVSFTYGTSNNGIANSVDQLTQVHNAWSTSNYTSFDAMQRVTASNQVTNGQTYTFSNYSYNLAGTLTSETYPSGRVVTNAYDGANRLQSVSGKLNNVTTAYVSGMTYWPHGALSQYTRGNGLWSIATYNSRLQPVQMNEEFNSKRMANPC